MANEGEDALTFTRQVLESCNGFAAVTFFAVFDKANRDNSLDLMRELSRSEPRLVTVWAPENRCVVDAYVRGYREALAASCDWILEIDAGFSHRPADIPRFFDAMDDGLDCVFGSRFMPGAAIHSSWKRRIVSRGGTVLTNLLLGTRQTDMTSGFELFSRSTLEMVLERGIRSRAHFFQTEIKVHCHNLRFVEVPIVYEMASPRLGSQSLKDALTQLWRLFRSRSDIEPLPHSRVSDRSRTR
jgi:dolichol-phosphate mannosyltransferase